MTFILKCCNVHVLVLLTHTSSICDKGDKPFVTRDEDEDEKIEGEGKAERDFPFLKKMCFCCSAWNSWGAQGFSLASRS